MNILLRSQPDAIRRVLRTSSVTAIVPRAGLRQEASRSFQSDRAQMDECNDDVKSEARLESQIMTLEDGRTLGYAEYGARAGRPLLYFHGFPTSRIEASSLARLASRRNIRLLAIDRPGFGLSTHDPRRRIMDWPADVRAFAGHLGLPRFTVIGVSGGGPYALACARALPEDMVDTVGVFAGAPIWNKGFWTHGVPLYVRFVYLAANYWPWGLQVASAGLLRVVTWILGAGPIKRRIEKWLATHQTKPEHDLVLPRTHEEAMAYAFEGFARGTAGFVHETQLLTQDWEIDFENVPHAVKMWHGSKDSNAPVATIREMAKRMPHCVLKEYPDDNHYTMGNHIGEGLAELMP